MQISYHNKVFFSMAYNYLGRFVSALLSFFAFTYVVRTISVGDYGFYGIVINIIFFITLFLDFGIPEIVLRYFPEYIEKKNLFLLKELLNKCLKFMLFGSVFLAALTLATRSVIPHSIKINFYLRYFPFLIIFGSLRVLTLVFGNILNAFFYQGYRNICEIIYSLFKLLLFYISIKLGYGVWGLIISWGLADLLLILLYLLKLYKPLYVQSRLYPSAEKISFRRFIKFGRNEYLYKLFWFFTDNRVDIYVVTYFLGITLAGFFAFSINVVNLIIEWSPATIFRSVISPMFVRQYTKNKMISELQYLFKLYNKFLIFLSFPLFLFIGILAKEVIVYIFDPKYINSLATLQIFLFFVFFINLLIPIRHILIVMERPDISNLSNIFAILKFILILLLIKFYSMNGVAIAYGIALLAIIIFNLILMKRFFNPGYPWRAIFKIFINGLAVGLVLYLIKSTIIGIGSLLIVTLSGIGVYAVLSYYNKPFNDYDRELLNKGFKIPIWHF